MGGKGEKEESGKVVGWVVLGIFEVGKRKREKRNPPSWLGCRKMGLKLDVTKFSDEKGEC